MVYLYQTWIHPIDKNRPNEYGQTYSKCEKIDAVNVSKSENLEIKSNGITQRKSSRLKNV